MVDRCNKKHEKKRKKMKRREENEKNITDEPSEINRK